MISAAHMATTSSPFVVYDFFDTVQKIMEANNFTASQIWNCDETGFPADAGQCKVIAPRGKQPNLQVVQAQTIYQYLQPAVRVGKP